MIEAISLSAVGVVGLSVIIIFLSLRHMFPPESAAFHCIMIGLTHILLIAHLNIMFFAPPPYPLVFPGVYLVLNLLLAFAWAKKGRRYKKAP